MFNRQKALNTKDLIVFCRHLANLLQQGINLRTALLLIGELDQNKWHDRINDIVNCLDMGDSLSTALQRYGFPNVFTSFVTAGEHHNGIVQALEKCEQYYRHKYNVNEKLLKALTYPLIVFLLMVGAFMLMQTTVLPRFATLYETIGVELPWYTQWLFTINAISMKTVVMVSVPLTLVVLVIIWRRKHQSVLSRFIQLSSKLPIIRETWQLRFTSVFSWQLGLLLQAGIPVIQAFDMVARNWPWEQSKHAINRIQQRLKKGFSFHDSVSPESGKSFHVFLPRQLAIGEASGTVANMLLHSGAMADEQLEERVQWLLRVWEPLLILFIGVLLAAMVLALFIPMLSLVDGL